MLAPIISEIAEEYEGKLKVGKINTDEEIELAAKFRAVIAIEKTHEERYRRLLKNVKMKQVFEKTGITIWECRNCGHVVICTKAPDVCPVCEHPQAYFEVKAENY